MKQSRWQLYVLKLEQDKWYVGITTQTSEKRFEQHKRGIMGAAWTRKYKPLKIHYTEDLGMCDIERAELYEGRVTRKYMEKYGDNNVRGGDLVDTDKYIKRFGKYFRNEDWYSLTVVVFLLLVIFYFVVDKYGLI